MTAAAEEARHRCLSLVCLPRTFRGVVKQTTHRKCVVCVPQTLTKIIAMPRRCLSPFRYASEARSLRYCRL